MEFPSLEEVLVMGLRGRKKMVKKRKGYHKLTGKTNLKYDRRHKALRPGKRISRNGKVYYEYRKNRSDVHGRKALRKK